MSIRIGVLSSYLLNKKVKISNEALMKKKGKIRNYMKKQAISVGRKLNLETDENDMDDIH